MAEKIKIKLGNITNLSDARFAAAAGIDYMGFCFDTENENYISPVKAKQIIDWTSGSFIVAEFGNQSLEEILTITEILNIDVLELKNNIEAIQLADFQKPIIKKIDTSYLNFSELNEILQAYSKHVDAFHLYSSKHELPNQIDLKDVCARHKIIWGYPTAINNLNEILSSYKPFAINLIGSAEEKTGLKDFDELNELLETIGFNED